MDLANHTPYHDLSHYHHDELARIRREYDDRKYHRNDVHLHPQNYESNNTNDLRPIGSSQKPFYYHEHQISRENGADKPSQPFSDHYSDPTNGTRRPIPDTRGRSPPAY
jgi:hypothetical protein